MPTKSSFQKKSCLRISTRKWRGEGRKEEKRGGGGEEGSSNLSFQIQDKSVRKEYFKSQLFRFFTSYENKANKDEQTLCRSCDGQS